MNTTTHPTKATIACLTFTNGFDTVLTTYRVNVHWTGPTEWHADTNAPTTQRVRDHEFKGPVRGQHATFAHRDATAEYPAIQ